MKIIKQLFNKMAFQYCLLLFSFVGMAQVQGTQFTVSLSNPSSTLNTFEVDIHLIVNPTGTALAQGGNRLSALSYGVNFDQTILNGGTPSTVNNGGTWALIPGSRDAALSALIFAQDGTYRGIFSGYAQNRIVGTNLSGTNSINLAPGSYKLGRYRFTNTVNFTASSDAKLWIQPNNTGGATNTLVAAYAWNATTSIYTYSTVLPSAAPGVLVSHSQVAPLSVILNAPTNVCATSAVASNLVGVTPCVGAANGSAKVTLSPIPTNLAVMYSVDGGTAQAGTLNASGELTVSGLQAGGHTVAVTPTACATVTTSLFTISGTPLTTNGSITESACGSYTWTAGTGLTYNTSGSYTHTVGCNTATLSLTITPNTTTGSSTESACGTYTWPVNGNTYTNSGTYTFVSGCNTATLNLTILPSQTPTVALASSDNDNTFPYGTPVTFTATPSNLGGGTAMYDFKVNGVSVQNSASNTYFSNTIADMQQVSVSMVVSSGACLTANTANSNTITNTVTGAVFVDFLYANSYCGLTVDTINPTFYCTTPSVGASSLSYRFVFTNTVTGLSQTVNRSVPNANLLLTTLAAYNTLYTVKVAAVVDGVLQPYSELCSVTTPALPLNKVVSTQCGATLAALNSTINVTTITGAVNYRFRVSLASNPGVTEEFVSAFPSFRLTSLMTIPLNFGNTYNVQVQSDIVNNGVSGTSAYGDVCTVATPGVTAIVATPNTCGATLAEINSRIYVNSVPGATQYTYRVALATAPTTYYMFSTPFTNFRLTAVAGLPLLFSTTYNVSVSVTVMIGGQPFSSGFNSTPCQYTTPEAITTQIQSAQCGTEAVSYQVPSNSTSVVADFVSGASYRFKLENLMLAVPYSQTISRPVNNFTLSMFTGLTAGTEYTVSVALDFYGVGDFGKDCDIRTPGAAPAVTRVKDTPFSALAYPNPFATNFTVEVTTKSLSNVSIKVYDMIGRLVEERSSTVNDLQVTTIGDRYPSGVYNVIVTQDSDVSTIRMIKR